MEETSTKALIFAISIFVTIIIVSLIIASFNEIKQIYVSTKNTDISIHSQFDSIYLTYDGKEMNGMGLLNTLRKFEDDTEQVWRVDYPGKSIIERDKTANERESEQLKEYLDNNQYKSGVRFRYENQYKVSVLEIDGKTTIKFILK